MLVFIGGPGSHLVWPFLCTPYVCVSRDIYAKALLKKCMGGFSKAHYHYCFRRIVSHALHHLWLHVCCLELQVFVGLARWGFHSCTIRKHATAANGRSYGGSYYHFFFV